MHRYSKIMISLGVLCLGVIGAQATEGSGRYVLKAIEGGYLRLDTKTGAVSTCTKQDNNVICRAAADDRAVLQKAGRTAGGLEEADDMISILSESPEGISRAARFAWKWLECARAEPRRLFASGHRMPALLETGTWTTNSRPGCA